MRWSDDDGDRTAHDPLSDNGRELSRLRRFAESQASQALQRGNSGAVREWALLDTLLSPGLRASEVAALRIRDCLLGYGQSALLVRHGKGDKAREVFIPIELKAHLKAFVAWKETRGEDVAAEAFVFTGQRGAPGGAHPQWRVADSQGPPDRRGVGSPVLHALLSAHLCHAPLPR
jgi:site-specific recombinase XerC